MIVRVQGEGQYELDDSANGRLDELDAKLFAAIESSDEPAFREALDSVVSLVESQGSRVPDERVVPSDLILPASDTSLDEARRFFTDKGFLHPVEA